MLPADSPVVFWDPASDRVSKTHSTGTEKGRVKGVTRAGKGRCNAKSKATVERGLLAPPRLGLCPLLKERVSTWHLPEIGHPWPEALPPVTWRWVSETEGWRRGPSTEGVLAPADLWALSATVQ